MLSIERYSVEGHRAIVLSHGAGWRRTCALAAQAAPVATPRFASRLEDGDAYPAISRGSHVTIPGNAKRIAIARICNPTKGIMPL